MKKKNKKIILWLSLFMFGFIFASQAVTAKAANMSYAVHANLPENQQDKTATYFDLNMAPGQKQRITVTIENNSDEAETIIVSVNNAITNQNGAIDYSKHKFKKDGSLKLGMEDIVKNKYQEIKLKAKEVKEVPLDLEMPEEEFDGIVLGGIHFAKKDQKTDSDKKQNVQIRNQYAYVIGIKLAENDNFVIPNLKLIDAQASLMNYRQVITASLQNNEATIIRDLKVVAKITKKGQEKVYKSYEKADMSMAPNSNFNFPVPLDGETFKPGKYTMHIEATAEKGKYRWRLSQDFMIDRDQAKKLNQEAVKSDNSQQKLPIWLYVVIGLALILIGILIFTIVYLLRKNKKQKNARRSTRR